MLSPADMLIIGAVALIAFGPDQLPKVARRAGQVMRDVQNTSQGFIREMERAADDVDMTHGAPSVHDSHPYGRISEPTPAPEPFAHDGPARMTGCKKRRQPLPTVFADMKFDHGAYAGRSILSIRTSAKR
ncbi:MAG: hypothetical protein NVS1B2_07130 [Vulcanimicrobiaceae bacterium]